MLNIFICEDNEQQLDRLIEIVNNSIFIENYDMRIKLATPDPHEILKAVKESDYPCVYFIDIELGASINGIELCEMIRKYDSRAFIIIVTTHAEMRPITFKHKVEALDYIIKDDLKAIEKNVSDCLANVHEKHLKATHEVVKVFHLNNAEKITYIDFNDILFFETSTASHKVILHATDRQIEFYGLLKDISKDLDERFYMCHKSFIVNKEKIKEFDKKSRVIRLINDEECVVAARRIKAIT